MRFFESEVFADYFQFYIQDESVSGNQSENWTSEALDRLLIVSDGVIGIGTVSNTNVAVSLELAHDLNDWQTHQYDQVNECSLLITSGKLIISGCTDYSPDAKRIELDNGWYRVRIGYGSLTKLSEDDLEGKDFYDVVIWPDSGEKPLEVIKQRET